MEKDQWCPVCRERLQRVTAGQSADAIRPVALCFQCYRKELDRERALREADGLAADCACGPREQPGPLRGEESGAPRALENARWQWLLPFEPVDKARLERLKADRATARATMMLGAGRYTDKRRQAQIAARRALHAIAAGLNARQLDPAERDRVMAGAIRSAELQLPESWLPFVVAR